MHFKIFIRLIIIALFIGSTIKPFDRSFFYRASSFWDEPRFEVSSLTTLNVQLTGGSTKHGKNNRYKTTSIFGIYGKEDGISSLGKFIFTGTFDLFEANFNVYQNLIKGFFVHFHLPVVSCELFPMSCYKYKPLCYLKSNLPSINQVKLLTLNEKLKNNAIMLDSVKEHGLSDTSLLAGWSLNYEGTTHLDFIDFALQLGVLFPTGRKLCPNLLFDIPLGYNGHWGIPWIVDFSVGAYEWLTWGLHNDGVLFFNHSECIPLTICPTGLLRFNTADAIVKSGPVWRIGTYIKADHIFRGLSFLAAFTFEQKNRNKILYSENNITHLHAANRQEWLKTWNRLMTQFILEYDFSYERNGINNRIAFLYNHQITGKRVFSTDVLGGYFGFDVLWCF